MRGDNLEICLWGMSFHTASTQVREQLARRIDAQVLFETLDQEVAFLGGVCMSTCNRIEVYAHGVQPDTIMKALLATGMLSPDIPSNMTYTKQGQDVMKHIMTVASSLDSMVVGEPQILGQVKAAYQWSKHNDWMSPLLHRMFQKTFQLARRIRRETSIGQLAVSLSSVAVDLSNDFFDSLQNKEVLILGAGEMAQLAAKGYQAKQAGKIYIANRTYQHAVDLAKRCHGHPLQMDQMLEKLASIDVILASTGANEYLLAPELIETHRQPHTRKPLLCIDVSVPRNIDPRLTQVDEVYLYSMDDLQEVVQKNHQNREMHAEDAKQLVESFCVETAHNLSMPSLSETADKVRQAMEKLVDQELRRVTSKVPLDDKQQDVIARSLMSLTDKSLHFPMRYVRHATTPKERARRMMLMEQMYMQPIQDEDEDD
jgi:glutamyl-tRNA reductase